jgi:hypothetical protein
MRVSFQICLLNGWDNNPPSFHDVETWEQAIATAYVLSNHFANSTVRVCKLAVGVPETADYIGRLSGCYVQSSQAITTGDYIQHIAQKGFTVRGLKK